MKSLKLLAAAIAAAMLFPAGPSFAQQAGGGACRADIQRLCSDVQRGGGGVMRCLRENRTALSGDCRGALREARQSRREGREDVVVPEGTVVMRDVAYGSDPKQALDVYAPPGARNAPIILMVHGGGWANGDKAAAGVVRNKIAHFLPRGYVFVSVDNRLIPQADPVEQAQDVARALAFVQAHAADWGGDAGKIVLMGHSAGAHLVALLSASPKLAASAGARPALGLVALDSAALDIEWIMRGPHPKLYGRAFGADPARWKAASPLAQVQAGTKPMLLVCSSNRSNSCPNAEAFKAAVVGKGGRAEVVPVALSHRAINVMLGTDNVMTKAVDDFLKTIGLP